MYSWQYPFLQGDPLFLASLGLLSLPSLLALLWGVIQGSGKHSDKQHATGKKAHQLSPWKSVWSTPFSPQATFQINWQDFPPADSKATCIDSAPFSPGTSIWTEHDSSDICWPWAEITSVSPRMVINTHDGSMSLCILELPTCKQHHWGTIDTISQITSPSNPTSEKNETEYMVCKDKTKLEFT